jgi:adenylate cyclase
VRPSPAVAIDFEAEGLLEGIEGQRERDSRLELLRQLEEDGASLEELRQAAQEGRLALLPVERVLMGEGPRYTSEEIAERAGLEREFLDRLWRALGLALADPADRVFAEEDLAAARNVKIFLDGGLTEEAVLEIGRVMGQGMANLAATIGSAFGRTFLQAGDTERDLGVRYAEATRHLAPLLGPTLEQVLRIHQREMVRQAVVYDVELQSGELVDSELITIAFADLVGFTKLGERIPPEELGAVAGRLGELASDVVAPPARLVKTIGDAAMLVSRDPQQLVATALDLVEAAEAEGEGFPLLRAGVARGPALTRGGDWYGRPVNLASRITDFARPGSVVATKDVRDATDGDYDWSFAGKRRFKNVRGDVTVFRVRRTEPAPE